MTYDLSYSVVRLTMRYEKTIIAVGSGFIYRRNNKYYIVTAWHNFSGRNSFSLEPLDKKHSSLPNNIIADLPMVTAHPAGGWMYCRMPIRFDVDDGHHTSYLVHQQSWPRVDVAVLPFDPLLELLHHEIFLSTGEIREYDAPLLVRQYDGNLSRMIAFSDQPVSVSLPDDLASWEIVHTVGDPLFLLGFPAGICDQSLTPIWKRATIASEPEQGWNRQEQMLVDSASRKGMSGGIALYYSKNGVLPTHPGSYASISVPLYIIHGVYVGRIGDSEFEAQVGVVWKKKVIDEIIDNGRQAISSSEIELAPSEVRRIIEAEYPEQIDHSIYLDEKPALYSFGFHLMTLLDGRANPDLVKEEIKHIARTRTTNQ